jgi:cytochrome c oxidase assembly protein subunit 11
MNKTSRRWTFGLAGLCLGMLGLSFAAKPLYDTFCRITGFGGETRVASVEAAGRVAPIDRPVRVRFDANVEDGLPMKFAAEKPFVDLKLGERMISFYEVTNTSNAPIRAMASYNVAPHKAGKYFNKIECFCFKTTMFRPGETVRLPVIFFVSPDLEADRFARDVQTVTLSYTYYGSSAAAAASAQLESGPTLN